MLRKLIFAMAGLAIILPLTAAKAAPPQRHELIVTPQSALQPMRSLTLPINKSEVFHVNQPISKIAVGNADIADAVVVSEQSFYIYGKKPGSTNIMIFDASSQLLAVLDIIVGADVEAIKRALYEALPGDRIAVRAVNGSFSLSGNVNSPIKVNTAMDIAKRFVDKDQTVINNLRVTGTQQVMLEVKVAEMQRTFTKSLGFKPFLSIGKPGNKSGFTFSTLDPVNITNFALLAGTAISGNFAFSELLDALEEKGAAKVLAEPNLVAMSGDTASFLAGGEFPIPEVQSTTGTTGGFPAITVEFKQFGVSLAFTPTVVDADLINLVVAPEVSQLDSATGVTINGFVIPGIDTRRAKTTVELRDGQSFAIAGLLSSDFNDTLRGIPGLMDVPVLGTLFHSNQYQRNETELVIIVTPRLVQPVPAGTLVAPTDTFVPPSDTQMIFYGSSENPDSGLPSTNGGGLTGKYGHIIR